MAHDVGQSLVNRTGNRAALWRRKPEYLRKTFEGATHNEQQFRIAKQFEFQ
jgi:hypothetical protein